MRIALETLLTLQTEALLQRFAIGGAIGVAIARRSKRARGTTGKYRGVLPLTLTLSPR
jgi:hypothetical protein